MRCEADRVLNGVLSEIGLTPGSLSDEVAVVTGAGRGLGRELALVFAFLGAKVAVAEVAESGAETERLIREAGGVALQANVDVSREADVNRLAATVRERFGPVTILVNSAIVSPVSPVVDTAPEVWDRVLAVNLRGAFLTCRAFLPGMLAAGHGTIVNLTSAHAMPFAAAYAASKEALAGLSQSLAAEVGGRGVRVIAYGPGIVDTPGLRESLGVLARYSPMDVGEVLRGSIRPEVAAVAAAYLVARLADDYHGERVDAYEVLDRAGLSADGEPIAPEISAPGASPPGAQPPTADRTGGRTAGEEALARAEDLRAIVAETTAEFGKLPVFARPMAAHGFKSQTGQSVTAWVRTLDDLAAGIRTIAAGGAGQAAEARRLAASWLTLEGLLTRLGAYYRGAPRQVARFTRDKETLAEVTRIATRREEAVRSLVDACRRVVRL